MRNGSDEAKPKANKTTNMDVDATAKEGQVSADEERLTEEIIADWRHKKEDEREKAHSWEGGETLEDANKH